MQYSYKGHSAAGVEGNLFGKSVMCVLCQTTHSELLQEGGHKKEILCRVHLLLDNMIKVEQSLNGVKI